MRLVSEADIAKAMGLSLRAVNKRATQGRRDRKGKVIELPWPIHSRRKEKNGNETKLYLFDALPLDVRGALDRAVHHRVAVLPAPTFVSSSPAATTAGALPAIERPERPAGFFIPAVSSASTVPMCIDPAAPPAVIMVRGTPHKARDDAHLNDKQRAQRDGALVLCRALDAAIAATDCAIKEACQNVAERILGGIAHQELIEAATITYVKPRASGQTVSSLTSRLQKMFPLYRAGCLTGDPGLYLVPGAPEPTGHDPIHIHAFLRHYCKPSRPSVADVWRDSKDWFAEQHLPRPAVDTFYRIENSLPVTVKYRGRVTGSEWRALKPYVDRDVSMFKSNDIWVGDGHSFKAKVQHPIHGQPFVPEVTIIIDWVSRKIVGWSVDLAESTVAVSAAFRNAQMNTRARPLVYYSDNGSGQTGKPIDCPIHGTLARQCIAHETGIPGNPQGRGIIERLWQVVTIPLARTYPTCTWKGADKEHTRKMLVSLAKKDGSGEKLLPSFNQFLDDLAEAIRHYNAEHEHRELGGLTPDEAYQAKLDPESIYFVGPSDDEIAMQWLPEVARKPQRGIISLFGNEYDMGALSDDLAEDERVRVRFDIHYPQHVLTLRMDGRPLGVANWNGHKVAAFPVPYIEQLRAKRAAGKIKRGESIIAEARAELGRVIDLRPESAFVPAIIDLPAAENLAAIQPVPAAEAKPNLLHLDDPALIRWLAAHPEDWNDNLRRYLDEQADKIEAVGRLIDEYDLWGELAGFERAAAG